MKKFITLSILAAGMVALGGSCTTELEDTQVIPSVNKVTITASFPEVTKITMSEGTEALELAWEESDYLTIVSGEQSEKYELVSIEGKVATFAGEPLEGESFDIILSKYDDNYMTRSYEGQNQSSVNSLDHLEYDAVLKGVSTYNAVSFTSEWAEANDGNLYQNGCLCLHFQMPHNAGQIKSITLSTEEDIFYATNSAEGKKMNALTLELENADMQEGNIIKAYIMTSMQEAVIPAETELTLTVVSTKGTWAKSFTPGESKLQAGMRNVIKLNKNNWNVPAGYGSGVITTADQWNEFAAYLNGEEKDADKGWFVDGVAKIGADIEGDLASINELPEDRVIDGNGKTITRTNATAALFGTVAGEVKNLTLAGSLTLTDQGAPLVNTLAAGGKVTGCTNEMTVTFEAADHAYVAGRVKIMQGGTIEDCTNEGEINVKVDASAANRNVAVGGIVSQINAGEEAAVLKDCINTANVTLTPKSATDASKGMPVCALGGVAGWLRAAGSFNFTNCDNSGAITLSAADIQSKNGFKAYAMCVGGIIGTGAAISTGSGIIYAPDATQANFDITLNSCDNTGVISNQGVNYSGQSDDTINAGNKKVFTGGLAGSLLGTSSNYVAITSCSNTGDIYTYNLTGENSSTQPGYCSVVGGFVGFGGYLNMDQCTVNCKINDGKDVAVRPTVSIAGVIGFTLRPFSLSNSNVYYSGYFQRLIHFKFNRAVVAVVPAQYLDINGENPTAMAMKPNVEGSTISNCRIGGLVLSGTQLSSDNKSDNKASLSTKLFNSESKTSGNLVYGQGFTTHTGVTVTDYTYWDGK